jgi:PIN domain nuclease of toxin-antitoxin system
MRCLLDSQAFLWFVSGNSRLGDRAREVISDIDNQVLLSIASLWEIAIKSSLGKLDLGRPFAELIPRQLVSNEIEVLPIGIEHLVTLMELPFHHRDPFDRLIIAQAKTERIPVVSSDSAFRDYPVQIVW